MSKKYKKIFYDFLMPYIIILAISLGSGFLIQNKTIKTLQQEVIDNNFAMLEQAQTSLDARFTEVSYIIKQITMKTDILKFCYVTNPFYGSNVCKILYTQKSIPNFSLTNNFVEDYYIIYGDNETILSPNSTYKFDEFHNYILYRDNMKLNGWKDFYFGRYKSNKYVLIKDVTYKNKKDDMLICMQSFGTSPSAKGVIMMILDNRQIEDRLMKLNIQNNGWAYIIDQNNDLISSVSSNNINHLPLVDFPSRKGFIRDRNMLITYTTSDYNGWKYVMAQPYDMVIKKVSYIKKITVYTFGIMLFIGLSIAYNIAARNSKYMSSIIEDIGINYSKNDLKSTYALIRNTFVNLFKDNQDLKSTIEEQSTLLKDSFIRRLFKGEIKTKQELSMLMQHTGVSLSGKSYGVIIITIDEYQDTLSPDILKDLDIKRTILIETLNQINNGNFFIHVIEQDKIALLIAYNDTNYLKSETCQKIEKLKINMYDRYITNMHFAIGSTYKDILDVSLSYKEAFYLTNYKGFMGNDIIWYDMFNNTCNTFYYPEDIEFRLINSIKSGNNEELEKILAQLYNKNFITDNISVQNAHIFLCNILGTMAKLYDQMSINDEHIIHQITSIADTITAPGNNKIMLFSHISNIAYKLCEIANQSKKSHNAKLIQDIVLFINNHYSEYDLSLIKVSQEFGLSEVYLSQFFKEQTGENFSNYVEKTRMDKARNFLSTTQLSINEISNKVGYNSVNTFCRAFKRINGITAGQYRIKSKSASLNH